MLGKVLVTGATGRVGIALVRELVRRGVEVVSTSRSSADRADTAVPGRHIKWNLAEAPLPRSIMRDIDTVFHLAQVVGTRSQVVGDPAAALANCLVDRNVALSVEESNVRSLIFSSSSTAGAYRHLDPVGPEVQMIRRVREPAGLFGSAKLTSERLFENLNSRYLASGLNRYKNARIYTIFGGAQGKSGGVVDWWLNNLRQGAPIVVVGAKQLRNFIHIDDVISQLIELAIDTNLKSTIDIASDVTLTLESAAKLLIEKKCGLQHQLEFKSEIELWDHIPNVPERDLPRERRSYPLFPEGLD